MILVSCIDWFLFLVGMLGWLKDGLVFLMDLYLKIIVGSVVGSCWMFCVKLWWFFLCLCGRGDLCVYGMRIRLCGGWWWCWCVVLLGLSFLGLLLCVVVDCFVVVLRFLLGFGWFLLFLYLCLFGLILFFLWFCV